MRSLLLLLITCSSQALAEACLIKSHGEQVELKICQQNRSIPPNLFRKGFCQPNLKGQQVRVSFVEQCPVGYFGACRNAQTGSLPYRQDIYYYGVSTDARYLQPACERMSRGIWMGYQ